MNSTRQQRRAFVLNAKKQWKRGEISKQEYLELKKQIADMGVEKNMELKRHLLENDHSVVSNDTISLDDELEEDDFTPDDL